MSSEEDPNILSSVGKDYKRKAKQNVSSFSSSKISKKTSNGQPNRIAVTVAKMEYAKKDIRYVDGIDILLAKYNLKFEDTDNPWLSKWVGAESTKKEMIKRLKQLKYFLIRIGRYDDLLMLHKKHIKNAPSIQVESLQLFLAFKTQQSTTEVQNPTTLVTLKTM